MWRCHWNKHWTGRDSRISGLWIKKTAMLLKRLDTQTMSENKLSVGQKWYQKWLQFCGLSLFIMHLRPRCIGSCFAQLTCWTWACNCVWTLRHFPYHMFVLLVLDTVIFGLVARGDDLVKIHSLLLHRSWRTRTARILNWMMVITTTTERTMTFNTPKWIKEKSFNEFV